MNRFCLVTSLLLLLPAAAQGQEPYRPELTPETIEANLCDEYYGVYIQGSKCGWARVAVVRKEEPTRYVSLMELTFRLTAMGSQTEMEIHTSHNFSGEAPYAWSGSSETERENDQVSGRALRPTDEGLKATTFGGGERSELALPAVDYALADYLAVVVWAQEASRAVGDGVSYRSLDMGEGRLEVETQTITALRELLISGVKSKVFDVVMLSEEEGEVGTGVLDERGNLLSAVLMGMVEMRLEPEELAKQIEFSADLFVGGMASLDRGLGEPDTVRRLQLRVEGEAAETLGDGPWQHVEQVDGQPRLTIDVTGGKRWPAEPDDTERYLRETPALPIGHPKVQALAARAVGDAVEPAEKAANLVHFVAEYVEDAYGRDQIDLLSVIERKIGDCTEHAQLLNALGRAAGIPTREVSGLVYMGDEVKAFGAHAWNEMLLDGHWVPVDATWDEVTINATHIKLSHEGGQEGMGLLGKLRFVLVEVEHRE